MKGLYMKKGNYVKKLIKNRQKVRNKIWKQAQDWLQELVTYYKELCKDDVHAVFNTAQRLRISSNAVRCKFSRVPSYVVRYLKGHPLDVPRFGHPRLPEPYNTEMKDMELERVVGSYSFPPDATKEDLKLAVEEHRAYLESCM